MAEEHVEHVVRFDGLLRHESLQDSLTRLEQVRLVAEPRHEATKHLLAHIRTPGLPVELLFKQVRLSVAKETGRVQVPWESSSLTGDFCFRLGPQGSCSTGR